MKRLLALATLGLLTLGRLPAQSVNDAADPDAPPPPGSTVVTSDQLRADQANHTAVFSGNVVVVGNNFTMHCQEMTVAFTKDSKVETITAKGDVVIEQPGRISHSGQAQYFHNEDKFVLTDQPNIIDNKNKISAPVITIYRTQQSMFTTGRTRTELIQGIGGPTSPAPATGAK